MKKSILILIFLTVLAAGVLIPSLADPCIWDKVSRGKDIVTALSSLITLVIALLLYNRFGVEKSVRDRQTNAVIALLEAMKRLRLVIHGDAGIFLFTVHRDRFEFFQSQNLGDKTLLFNYRYLEEMKKVEDALENVFMPKSVRKEFQALISHVFIAVMPDQTLPEDCLFVDTPAPDEKKPTVRSTVTKPP